MSGTAADDGVQRPVPPPTWVRMFVALMILILLLWAAWGFKDRPLTPRPLDLEKGSYPLAIEKGPSEEVIERTRLRARQIEAW